MNTGLSASVNATESRPQSEQSAWSESPPAPLPPPRDAGAPPVALVSPSPASPPPDACPLTCTEARGPVSASLTTEENAQLRASLEPVIAKMRACVPADDWRSQGSPVIHLRMAADGKLMEMGVDPHHGLESSCFEDAAKGASPSIVLPGRKAVRCVEKCASDGRGPRRGRRGREDER